MEEVSVHASGSKMQEMEERVAHLEAQVAELKKLLDGFMN